MSYNGYKNYETWNVALWVDNDEGLYDQRRELARSAWSGEEEAPVSDFANILKDWVNDPENGMIPDLGATMASDLLSSALSEVDWYELAEAWLEEDKPEAEEAEA